MKPEAFAKRILYSGSLLEKIQHCHLSSFQPYPGEEIPLWPSRERKIQFSQKRVKFPKINNFHLKEKRAMALHYFANHELLAIEMMAAFLLKFPTKDESDKKLKNGILTALQDEQKHLSLYLQRMVELGVEFGDYPLNDFFWKQMVKVQFPNEFLSLMSLTLESANLDFSAFYRDTFHSVEDFKSAEIMETIFQDELTHVKLGLFWLKKWRKDKNLFDYYQSLLPENITPSRAMGIGYQRAFRALAGFDNNFIEKLENYKDSAPFLKRKNKCIAIK